MFFPIILNLLERFKTQCQCEGWKICNNEDLVNVDNEYHYFIWIKHNNPGTFRKTVCLEKKIPVKENSLYKLVNVTYIAWISSESLSNDDLKLFFEIPGLAKRVAIYDLNLNDGETSVCSIINETDSAVFKKFENFLSEEFKVKLILLPKRDLEIAS